MSFYELDLLFQTEVLLVFKIKMYVLQRYLECKINLIKRVEIQLQYIRVFACL